MNRFERLCNKLISQFWMMFDVMRSCVRQNDKIVVEVEMSSTKQKMRVPSQPLRRAFPYLPFPSLCTCISQLEIAFLFLPFSSLLYLSPL